MAQEHGLGKMTMGQALDALDRDGSVGVHLVGLPTASGLTFGEFTYDSRAVMPTTLYACKGATFKEGYLRERRSIGGRPPILPSVLTTSTSQAWW